MNQNNKRTMTEHFLVCTYFGEVLKCILRVVNFHYCARCSLGTRVPRHIFQALAANRNSTKYIADDPCVNLVCEYFCWVFGDPHSFFGRSLLFLILSIILKSKKKSVPGKFSSFLMYYSHRVELVQGYRCA